jgi:hypothetical protein
MQHEVINLYHIVVLIILIVSVLFRDICKEWSSRLYFSSGRIGWVSVNSAGLHQVNAFCKFRAECLEQLAESQRVRPSAYVFGRVSMFNPWDPEVPLPPNQLQRSWWRARLSVYTMQLLIPNVFALLLISVVSDMSKNFLNHIRKIRPSSWFTW